MHKALLMAGGEPFQSHACKQRQLEPSCQPLSFLRTDCGTGKIDNFETRDLLVILGLVNQVTSASSKSQAFSVQKASPKSAS